MFPSHDMHLSDLFACSTVVNSPHARFAFMVYGTLADAFHSTSGNLCICIALVRRTWFPTRLASGAMRVNRRNGSLMLAIMHVCGGIPPVRCACTIHFRSCTSLAATYSRQVPFNPTCTRSFKHPANFIVMFRNSLIFRAPPSALPLSS